MSSNGSTGRRYIVRHSKIHGRGVFALTDIPKGTRLMEYLGERITHREADRRYAAEHEHSPHTMLFAQCGMFFLATGTDLVTLFIGLELMALCFYIMVGFLRSERRSNEFTT